VAYVLSRVVSGLLQWLMFCLVWLAVGYSGLCLFVRKSLRCSLLMVADTFRYFSLRHAAWHAVCTLIACAELRNQLQCLFTLRYIPQPHPHIFSAAFKPRLVADRIQFQLYYQWILSRGTATPVCQFHPFIFAQRHETLNVYFQLAVCHMTAGSLCYSISCAGQAVWPTGICYCLA